jgi:hypothetical protein
MTKLRAIKDKDYIDYNIPTRTREPYPLPKLLFLDEFHYLMDPEMTGDVPFVNKIGLFRPDFFTMKDYQAHPHIKAPLSN